MTATKSTWITERNPMLRGWWNVYREGRPRPTYQVNDEKAANDLVALLNEAEGDAKYRDDDRYCPAERTTANANCALVCGHEGQHRDTFGEWDEGDESDDPADERFSNKPY